MSLNRITATILTLAALTFALTLPAAAGDVRGCKSVDADMSTAVVDTHVEVGPVEGMILGVAYLTYDDAAPPIDPQWSRPNLVITTKTGNLNLWVYSESKPDGGDSWWRQFTVLRAEGTGRYAGARMKLNIYGKCTEKNGAY